MKTLVLCVDRDNDVGVKTGIRGPLVGRDDCLSAAMKLGLADPEDADVNALLTSIGIYDELVKSGQPAEIAGIMGDVRVGPVSDQRLTKELEEVLEEVRPDRVYLVSDGAEDESIYPMIASRVRVDSTRRVFVRQAPALESTWYMLVRALREPKIRRKVVVPVGLALILFGVLWFVSPSAAVPAIALLVGLYILYSAFAFGPQDLLRRLRDVYERVRMAPVTGNLSIYFTILAVIPFLIGLISGVQLANTQADWVNKFLLFLGGSIIWFLLAFLVVEAGRAAEAYVRRGKVPRHVALVAGTFVATGMIIFATIDSLQWLFGAKPGANAPFILFIIGVSIIVLVASIASYRPRGEELPADSWRH